MPVDVFTNTDIPVSLVQIANELAVHRGSIKNAVMSRGFSPFRLKDARNGALYLSKPDATAFVERFNLERSLSYVPSDDDDGIDSFQSGLYAVRVPSYNGSVRLKIGWSDHLNNRLATYRTIVPDLEAPLIWYTTHKWTENILLSWARKHANSISQEVFEFSDAECLDRAICRFGFLLEELGIVSD